MATLTKALKGGARTDQVAALRDKLVEERDRLNGLLAQVEAVLTKVSDSTGDSASASARKAARPSPLDQVKTVVASTADLREANGNLSAARIAKVFGVSVSQLAGWLGRSKQAVSKTPDADSLQPALGYFERVARMRLVTGNDAGFRKWLRTPNKLLENASPLELLAKEDWQVMADYVDDTLTGAPT